MPIPAADSTLYAGLALLKAALGITDTTRDVLLGQALSSSARQIDKHCGRRFYADTTSVRIYRTRDRVVRDADGDLLLVDDIATDTGLIVQVGDGTAWTTVTDYETEPDGALSRNEPITGLRRISGRWSARRARVTAVPGWPAVPDQIVQAHLMQATRLFRRKDSPEGLAGSPDFGVVRLGRIDPDVQALLAPYVLPGIG